MYEVTILVCMFLNTYSTDLGCAEEKIEVVTCNQVRITNPRLYNADTNPQGDIFIKDVRCKKLIPVMPELEAGEKAA